MSQTSKLIFGAFILAVAMVMPSMCFDDFKGPVCRFVNSSTEAVFNETGCPFSDMDPPPFVCVNSSRGINNNRNNNNDNDRGRNRWWNFWRPRRAPAVRKDRCQLQLDMERGCTSDSDCPSFPGLMRSKCIRQRYFGSVCVPEVSSVALSILAARPCEIRRQGGDVIFRDLTDCRNQKSLWNNEFTFGIFEDNTDLPRRCESTPSITARVTGDNIYEIKTCVVDPNPSNEEDGNNDDGNDGDVNP